MIWTILTTLLLSLNCGVTVWLLFKNKNLTRISAGYKVRLNLVDHDIKTLHHNQKVLQSLVKEMRKDLLIYGEIKKSRTKAISIERQEES